MGTATSASPSPYFVLRVSRALGLRVREHVRSIRAAGDIDTITHFVSKAIEDALAKAHEVRS